MRWLLAAVLLTVAAPAYAQQNDAEKLFRAMEKKITTAKSLKVKAEADLDVGGMVLKFKSDGQLAEGNKARFEFEGDFGGIAIKMSMVSNGKQMIVNIPMGPAPEAKPTPANLNKMLSGATARAGLLAASGITEKGDIADMDLDKKAPVSDFKMGAKEKVGKADAQIIEYVLKFDGNDTTSVKLWIDTKTNLPLKRHVTDESKKLGTLVETYSEFVIDAQLDAKVFELPK